MNKLFIKLRTIMLLVTFSFTSITLVTALTILLVNNYDIKKTQSTKKLSIQESNYFPNPISNDPSDWWTGVQYQEKMGVGMDVDWAKVTEGMKEFDANEVLDFYKKGLRHVRIRTRERAYETGWNVKDGGFQSTYPDEDFFTTSNLTPGDKVDIATLPQRLYEYKTSDKNTNIGLDYQIKSTIDANVLPILAYQASEFKHNPVKEIDNVVEWWKTTAERYKNYPKELAFNLLIEFTNDLDKNDSVEDELGSNYFNLLTDFFKTDEERTTFQNSDHKWNDVPSYVQIRFLRKQLNILYEKIYSVIREISPYRIIIMAPNNISSAYELPYLDIPIRNNLRDEYLIIEWHFYAAGPTKRMNSPKKWTIGTLDEQKHIVDEINFAKEWSDTTGIPTWVGAWMPNNFNKNPQGTSIGEYSIPEQIKFASFMSCQLKKRNIPHAINSDTKYYDRVRNQWIHFPNRHLSHTVLDAAINPAVNEDTCLPLEI